MKFELGVYSFGLAGCGRFGEDLSGCWKVTLNACLAARACLRANTLLGWWLCVMSESIGVGAGLEELPPKMSLSTIEARSRG